MSWIQADVDWWKANESPLDQSVEGDISDYDWTGGCGPDQMANRCIGCGSPMGKSKGEDPMSPPVTDICSSCFGRNSEVQ